LFMFAPVSFGMNFAPYTSAKKTADGWLGAGEPSGHRGVSLTRQSQKGFEREDHLLLISFPVCS
jgi:hypothetical protein